MIDRPVLRASLAAASSLLLLMWSTDAMGAPPAKLTGDVRIGAIVPSSGPLAEWGRSNTIALQMLQDQVNAAGGVNGAKLEIIIYDDGAKPDQAATLARKLAEDDKVLAIAGPLTSSAAEVAFPLVNQLGITATSQASSKPGLAAKNRPWAFRNEVNEAANARVTVPFYKAKYGVKSVAVIYDAKDAVSTSIGTSVLPTALKKAGIAVLNEGKPESFNTGDLDVSAQVTAMKALKPGGVVIAADYSQAITVLREMTKQGLNVPVIGGGPLISSSILQAAPDIPIVTAATNYMGLGGPAGKFNAELSARFKQAGALPPGTDPSMYDANIYEIVQMYVTAAEHAGITNKPSDLQSDRVKIRDFLTSTKHFVGLGGPVSFDRDGDAVKRFYVVVGQHGKWTAEKAACSVPNGC